MPVDRSGLHVYEKLRQAVFSIDVSDFITKPSLMVKVFYKETVVLVSPFVLPAKKNLLEFELEILVKI